MNLLQIVKHILNANIVICLINANVYLTTLTNASRNLSMPEAPGMTPPPTPPLSSVSGLHMLHVT